MSTTVSSSRPPEGNLVVALSVQEMFLVVRAEDRASNTMRKISKSIAGMGDATAAATAEQKFANAQTVLANKLGTQRGKLTSQTEAHAKATKSYSDALNKANVAEQRLKSTQIARQEALRRAGVQNYKNKTMSYKDQITRTGNLVKNGELVSPTMLQAGQAKMAAFETEAEKLGRQEAILQREANAANAALERQIAAMAKLAEAMGATKAEIAATEGQMRSMAAQQARMQPILDRADRGARRKGLGGAISGMGNQAVFAGGAGLAIAGLAANSAANLQRSTTLAATQASRSSAGIAQKAHQAFQVVLKQMGQFPAKAEDMSASLYDIFSSTNIQSISKGAKMLATLNKAAVAGQTDLGTATDATISILNAFKLPVSQLTPTMDKMFAAVRYGRMTFTQFGQSLTTIVPAFQNAHQSLDTMLGSMAFLTRRMPSVAASSVSLSRAVEVLGNQKLDKKFKKWGMSITDTRGRLKPLDEVIGTILKKFPGLAKGQNVMSWLKDMTNLQGTSQARRALHFLFTDFGAFRDILHKTTKDQGEFQRSYTALKDTPANKLAVAMNNLRAAWLNFGDSAIPMITDLMKKLTEFVGAFTRVNNATHGALGEIVAWGSIMTLSVGLGMKFVGMLLKIAGAFDAIAASRAMAGMTGGKGLFGRAAKGGIPKAFTVPEAAAGGALGEAGVLTASTLAATVVGVLGTAAVVGAGVYFASRVDDKLKTSSELKGGLKTMSHLNFAGVPGKPGTIGGGVTNRFISPQAVGAQLKSSQGSFNNSPLVKNTAKQLVLVQQAVADFYYQVSNKGLNVLSEQAENARKSLMKLEEGLLGVKGSFKGFVNTVSHNVHMPLSSSQIQGLQGIPKFERGNVKAITKATGRMPNTQFIKYLVDHRDADTAITALTLKMKHVPSTKQVKFLMKNSEVSRQITNFINKFKKLPSQKKVNLMINTQNAERKTKLVQDKIKNITGRHGMPDLQFNTGKATGQLGRLKQGLGKLKDITHKITFKYDPSNPVGNTQKAAAAMKTALTGIKITADTQPLEQALAQAVTDAAMQGAAAANAYNASWKSIQKSHSPSKVWIQFGKDLMSGLVIGVASKKDDFKSQVQALAQQAASTFDDIKSTMQGSFGDLFQGTTTNSKLQDALSTANPWTGKTPTSTTFKAVSGDLKAQLYRFKMWQRALNRLRSRGIPGALYQQLLAAGPDSLPMVQALANSSGKQLKTYNKMFKQEQGMIGAASKAAFGVQTKMWKSMGQNVAFGFLAGLRQETPAITKYIHNMMLNLFGTAKKANKSHSPSKLWMSEGKNMLDGLQMGMSSYEPSFAPVGRGNAGGANSGGDTHFHFAPTIYGNDYQSGLNKARFDFQQHVSRKLPR